MRKKKKIVIAFGLIAVVVLTLDSALIKRGLQNRYHEEGNLSRGESIEFAITCR